MKFVQLLSLKDLIMLVASSPTSNVIQHLSFNESHLYFLIGGTLNEIFLYFVKEKKPVLYYNKEISLILFSDSFFVIRATLFIIVLLKEGPYSSCG